MKVIFFYKAAFLTVVISLFCSFIVMDTQNEKLEEAAFSDWENCIREASGKIASTHSGSVLNVEYSYAKKNLKVKNGKKGGGPELQVKLKILWNSNNINYSVDGHLSSNSSCCNVTWKLVNASSTVDQNKILKNLGCVEGSSTNSTNTMGAGRPFVRRKRSY